MDFIGSNHLKDQDIVYAKENAPLSQVKELLVKKGEDLSTDPKETRDDAIKNLGDFANSTERTEADVNNLEDAITLVEMEYDQIEELQEGLDLDGYDEELSEGYEEDVEGLKQYLEKGKKDLGNALQDLRYLEANLEDY